MKKMEAWLIFSILALITWGFLGFFPNEVIGGILFGVLILLILNFKLQTNFYGITFGILTVLLLSYEDYFSS